MKSRFNVEQIIKILRESETASTKEEVLRKYNISPPTLYRWKCKYQGMDVKDAIKLKALERENSELKDIVAELTLKVRALDIVARKNF